MLNPHPRSTGWGAQTPPQWKSRRAGPRALRYLLEHPPRLDGHGVFDILELGVLEVHVLHRTYTSCICCEREDVAPFIGVADDHTIAERMTSDRTRLSRRHHLEFVQFPFSRNPLGLAPPPISCNKRILQYKRPTRFPDPTVLWREFERRVPTKRRRRRKNILRNSQIKGPVGDGPPLRLPCPF